MVAKRETNFFERRDEVGEDMQGRKDSEVPNNVREERPGRRHSCRSVQMFLYLLVHAAVCVSTCLCECICVCVCVCVCVRARKTDRQTDGQTLLGCCECKGGSRCHSGTLFQKGQMSYRPQNSLLKL